MNGVRRQRDSRRTKIWVLSGSMGLVGALSIAFATTFDSISDLPFTAPWWALAIGFGLAEVAVIHLHVRNDAHSISLAEIPFAFGLAFASPVALILGRLVGSGSALLVHRRQQPMKFIFNMSLLALETGTGVMVFRSVLGGATPAEPIGWVALFAGLFSVLVMGAGAVTIALAVNDRSRGVLEISRSMGAGMVIGMATSVVGIIAVTIVWYEPLGAIPVAVFGLLTVVASRIYRSLNERYEDLEAIYTFDRTVEEADDLEALIGGALRTVQELIRADVVQLALADKGWSYRAGDDEPTTLEDPSVVLRPTRDTGSVLHLSNTDAARLGASVRQAAVVAVPGSEGGSLVVAAPLTTSRVYDADDLRLLDTLARQLGQAFEREQLVVRLRAEVAKKDHRASHDELTGLPNRHFLLEALGRRIEDGERLAVGVVDLDHFKQVNDTLGHQHGDRLIAEIAQRLLGALEEDEVLARFGGDEFGVLLVPGDGVVGALDRARSVRMALSTPFTSEGFTFDISASVGIAMAPDDGTDPELLLRRADVAMHEAKKSGSGYEVYDTQRDRYSTRRLVVAGELRGAIADGLVEVHYQPKVAVTDLRTVGVEALARWNHERLGPVRPDEFVAVAEKTGLIGPLTELVMRTALTDLAKLRAEGHDIEMAINVAARSLSDSSFPALVAAVTDEIGVDPRQVTLEVTETMVMTDSPRTSAVLSALAEIGVRLSIDDFGTGYSSLAYLTRLPVDEVKIDRAFVGNMAVEHRHARIVRSTTDMAHALDLKVVAEGVENRATLELLRAARADVAQGYYFARPMPLDALITWLLEGGASGN